MPYTLSSSALLRHPAAHATTGLHWRVRRARRVLRAAWVRSIGAGAAAEARLHFALLKYHRPGDDYHYILTPYNTTTIERTPTL